MIGNWLLGIPKASKNGQAAADFIKWLTSPEVQRQYVAKGGIPSRLSLLNDATLNEQNPYFAALAKSLQAGPNWRPRTDQWNAVETILGKLSWDAIPFHEPIPPWNRTRSGP